MNRFKEFSIKKLGFLAVFATISIAMTGCGIDLTDEQNRLIAEYAADLLLKYDADYQARYNEDNEDTEEVPTTADTTEYVTEQTTQEDTATTEDLSADVSTEDTSAEDVSTEEDEDFPPVINDNVTDIAEIVGIHDISIIYNKCMFLDRYPSIDQDGAFIYLEADPGYKLVVVKFDITNQSSSAVSLDLLNTPIDYRLVMNGSKAAKPMLTILMDDLGTFYNTVPANSEQSAVLVFQMADGSIDKIETLDIRVTYENNEYIIHIQ